jgi:hypothetical protein
LFIKMRSRSAHHLLAASFVVTTGLSGTPQLHSSTGAGAQRPTSSEIAAALQAGGLHEAAHLSGGHYTRRMEYEPHPQTIGNVNTLVRLSKNVIIGDVVTGKAHLASSGQYITTDYRVRVVESLLGRMVEDTEIILSVLGGTVVFSDGLSASVEALDFDLPRKGERILAFLVPFASNDAHVASDVVDYANGDQIFRPAGMAKGVFGLSFNQSHRVRPYSYKSDKLGLVTRNLDVKTFVKEVRDAIEMVEREQAAKDADQ